MKSLIAPTFTTPSNYTLLVSPTPQITQPKHLLIKVHAASINAHDVIMASGRTKAVQNVPLPYRIGLDFSGEILATGPAVEGWTVGERVFGFAFHVGTVATHVLLDLEKPHALARIPEGMEFVEAASLPAVGLTADLVLKAADAFFQASGGLAGKTVFIPAALSGVGSLALQLAKRSWKCKTISAVSTAKLSQASKLLGEDVVDDLHDYTTENLTTAIGAGSVDFVFDTTGQASAYLPLIKRGGLCISIARLPPGTALKEEGQSRVACIGQNVMDGMDAAFRTYAKTRYGVTYLYQKTDPSSKDLEGLVERLRKGDVKAVVGETAMLDDLETVKAGCERIFQGKGGVGKFVVRME